MEHTQWRLFQNLIDHQAKAAQNVVRPQASKKVANSYLLFWPGSSSESSLLSLSSTMTPPSRKTVRSTGSLDRLRDETKKQSSPLKASSSRPQSFIPRRTSTPASKRGLSRNNEHRHSFHLSSLPEVSVTPARPNRWSIGDMTRGLMESNESLPNSPSASEGSDLQFCMDSEMESSTESEGWVRLHWSSF